MVDAPWVVWSFEHDAWWGPGWRGYTPDLAEAGRYNEAEAHEIEQKANRIGVINEKAMPLDEATGQADTPLTPGQVRAIAENRWAYNVRRRGDRVIADGVDLGWIGDVLVRLARLVPVPKDETES